MIEKLNNLDPAVALVPFKNTLGEHYPKIVADMKAFLGRIKAEEMKTEQSGWKITSKCVLKSKDGHSIQLPLNNPASTLLRFGMQLNELASNGKFEINATIPKECEHWVDSHKTGKNKSENAPADTKEKVTA